MTTKMTDTMTKTMKMGLTDAMDVDVKMLTQNMTKCNDPRTDNKHGGKHG